MAKRGVQILQFMVLLTVVRAQIECMSYDEFKDVYLKYNTDGIFSKNKIGPDVLEKIFNKVNIENPTRNPEDEKVYSFLESQRIDRVYIDEVNEADVHRRVKRRLKLMDKLCGEKTKGISKKNVCGSPFFANFYGCARDESDYYFFEERTRYSLESTDYKQFFINLPPLKRVEGILEIIDRFAEIQRRGIVHSYIIPENILIEKNTFDFKVTGFQFADLKGKQFNFNGDFYLAPERRKKNYALVGLTETEDVFSLALNLLELVAKSYNRYTANSILCFYSEEDKKSCQKNIEFLIKEAFNDDNKLSSLGSVFRDALEHNPKARIPTMRKFLTLLTEKFLKIDGAKEYVKDLLKKKQQDDLKARTPSAWKCSAISINLAFWSVFGIYEVKLLGKNTPVTCDDKDFMTFSPNGIMQQVI